MANRSRGFGMTAELNRKKAAKFDTDLANQAMSWMGDVLRDGGYYNKAATLPTHVSKQKDVQNALGNGMLLCFLINLIKPGSVKVISESNMAFKEMRNIDNFLAACEAIGVRKSDLFQTVDLYEGQNIPQVVNGIFALARKAAQVIGYDGPALGPEETTENKRRFTNEQLRAGEGVIGLQASSHKGASQAGQNFGKLRAIIDKRRK